MHLWYDEDMLDDSMTYAEKDMCSTLGIDIPSDTLKKRVEAGTSIDLGTLVSGCITGKTVIWDFLSPMEQWK